MHESTNTASGTDDASTDESTTSDESPTGDATPTSDDVVVADADAAESTRGTAESSSRFSRRSVLRTSAALGAGAVAFGSAGSAAGATKVQETCSTAYGKIQVSDKFTVMDNQWGMSDAQQCVWLNDDGSYGYDFDASNTGGGINYPEVYTGTRPWGDDTGVPEFPVRRGDVNDLVMDVEADVTVSGGEWDWAEEWWLMEQPPGQQPETHQYEIMLLLDWGGGHDHGTVQDRNAWTDQFGNTVSLWTVYNSGGTSATFYIFRIEGGHDGGKIDMKPIVDYMTSEGVSEDLYLSGIELGNEYWGGASGETTYHTFDVTVNGSTYSSGSGGTGSNGGSSGGSTDDGSADDTTDDGGSSGQSPYGGTPASLPGTIQAEDFDVGGEGVAYHDTTSGSEGGAYRSTDVDVESSTRGGYNVGWIQSGEWWEYTVDVASSGTYDLSALVASNAGGGSFHVEVDGNQVASTSFGATGGWQSWTTTSLGSVDLSAGEHVVRVVADAANWNFNWLEVADAGSTGGSDDGSTDDGSTSDGSTDDGSTSDGSTDDSTSDGSGGSSSGDPIATIDAGTTSAGVGDRVVFRVNDTSGSGHWIDGLSWDFGDGSTGSGWWQSHRFESAGSYTVALTATDNEGNTTTDTVTVTIS